jgi:predicted kinase
MVNRAEALLIGGRSGVGKSVVGWEVSARLRAAGVAHAIVEGDFMGQVHPPPADDPDRTRLVERNLTSVWANFAGLGYRRLIYTNTLSVLAEMTGMFERALGADVRLIRVLLTASDATAHERLVARELGSELADGLNASDVRARALDRGVPGDTARIPTDGRKVIDVATEIVVLTGWSR